MLKTAEGGFLDGQPDLLSCTVICARMLDNCIRFFFFLLLLLSQSAVSDSFATPWTIVHQSPLSVGFPKQEHWSGLPFPTPGDLPNPGIEPASPSLAGRFFTTK